MATTINELKDWFVEGKNKGATHMIVACDTWDWIDFPIYVMPEQDVKNLYQTQVKRSDMKVMEVYNLNKDIDIQLSQHRVMDLS